MLKKPLALVLIALLLQTTGFVIRASANNEKDAALARKVREDVMRLGLQARVRVKLKDNGVLEGNISDIKAEHFVITEARSNDATTITYLSVKQVKRNSLSTGAKIGIGVGVAAAVGIVIAIVAGRARGGDRGRDEPPCTRPAMVGAPCPPGCICIQ